VSDRPLAPERVIPRGLARAVRGLPAWFVVGGHAVRCLCPYRPSRDVDFGVRAPSDLTDLVEQLRRTGTVEISEQTSDTVHLRWNRVDVSIFVLPALAPHVVDRRLDVTGILGTKLHAILDRGLRRDFFDLYVTLQHQQLGIVECLRAIRAIHQRDVNDGLLLRALTFFDDADQEPRLPGEGRGDWGRVKRYFTVAVGTLLVPPATPLAIQRRVVDVAGG
jgi:hypothetical protein